MNRLFDNPSKGFSATFNPSASGLDIANRLHDLFPNAKIIIIFREKTEWINSLYAQYIKLGGVEQFEGWYLKFQEIYSLTFEEYEKCLHDLFDEVLVCQYENMRRNLDQFIEEICEFIGVETPRYEYKQLNIRLDKKLINRWIMINKLFKSKANPNGGILPYQLNPLNKLRYFKSDF